MPGKQITNEYLRAEIEATTAKLFPATPIEERIARALQETGHFHERINEDDLAVILRHVVYTIFAQQRVAGLDVGILHNIVSLNVTIADVEAHVWFVVHVHKPIVAFLEFKYTLENDPMALDDQLRLKRGTLDVVENTRLFDIKAKTALAALNVKAIARRELNDLAGIICKTLPPQLYKLGLGGEFHRVALILEDSGLNVKLEGSFYPNGDGHRPVNGEAGEL